MESREGRANERKRREREEREEKRTREMRMGIRKYNTAKEHRIRVKQTLI